MVYLGAMARPRPFLPVKPVCGLIASAEEAFRAAEAGLVEMLGPIEWRSGSFAFAATDYYVPEMGPGLKRRFLSFAGLIGPERLAGLKLGSNALEERVQRLLGAPRRVVNIDPGYITRAALIMATAKDFSHRIPLTDGIYAHLELLFTRTGIRRLAWTYPDYDQEGYQTFFLAVRHGYLKELKALEPEREISGRGGRPGGGSRRGSCRSSRPGKPPRRPR